MYLRRGYNSLLAGSALLLVCLAGCAKPTGDVTGTIKIDGKAPDLEGLGIEFLAADGVIVTATINRDGTFEAKKVPVGETRVGFLGGLPKGSSKSRRPGGADGRDAFPSVDLGKDNPIPEPLRAAATSDLTFTVEAGKNTFNYNIVP